MVLKKSLNLIILSILALFLSMTTVYSADVYVPYKTVFSGGEVPSDVFVSGYACTSSDCSSVDLSSSIELYSGNAATTCWADYNSGALSSSEFFTCMDNSKLNSNYQEIISEGDYIVVKYDSTNSFGYLTYFSASSDSYFVKYDRINDISCLYSTCFDNNYRNLEFIRGANAIAEIGNINIVNTDDSRYPVQVTVPVTISETVCSAYQLSNPNWWRATIPQGYSDYSAETDVKLTITNDDTGAQYFSKRITTSIFADNCATLNAFTWTPDSSLENVRVEFEVMSDVVDSQVVSSIKDFAYAYETIYPAELESTCYARVSDFMLSNEPSFDLSTAVTQIQVGENLFANFKASAFRDETATPMTFEFRVYFDEVIVLSESGLSSEEDLVSFHKDLTSSISSLSAGTHSVKLEVEPVGVGCDMNSNTTQIQNLIITEPEQYDVTFRVLGTNNVELSGALINFNSVELLTEDNGEVKFSNVLMGEYDYDVSYVGYHSKFGTVTVGSDVFITITLSEENSLPVVSFPDFTDYYINTIIVDFANYVVDYNEDFSDLTVSLVKDSGDSNYMYNSLSGILTLSSSGNPETSAFSVTVTDGSGDVVTDSFDVIFTDNSAPVITLFSADEYDGYKVFTTNFNIEVSDLENDELTCSINFADYSTIESGLCSDLNGVSHSFEEIGDYNVVLTVTDSFGNVQTADLDIYVYEEAFRPYADSFEVVSSNGNIVPTDLTFSFVGLHENSNEVISCQLIVNSVITTVDCDGSFDLSDYSIVGEGVFEFIVTDSNGYFDNSIIKMDFSEFEVPETFPFITSFDLTTSNGNYVPNDLTFDYVGGHEDPNEDIVCSITINSQDNSVPCTLSTFEVENYIALGDGSFVLTVTDESGDFVTSTITRNFIEEPVVINYLPFITSFDMTSSNGNYVSTDLTFDYVVGHENDEDIVCNLLINSVENLVDCEAGSFEVSGFDVEGDLIFELVVTEVVGDDLVSATIISNFEKEIINYLPFITSFDMTSSNGNIAPTDLIFNYEVGHENNETIICMISVSGTSDEYFVDCENGFFDLSNFEMTGDRTFTLTVTDLSGDEVFVEISTSFGIEENYLPFITSFDVTMSNGNVIPTDLTFDFVVGHENNETIICSIVVNSVSQVVDCNSNFTINNFNKLGSSTFELVVRDLDYDTVTSTIIEVFIERLVELSDLGINLYSDYNLELGLFDFSLEIENESMAKRLVGLRPELICAGGRAVIAEPMSREMAEGIYSSVENNMVLDFSVNTQDFNLDVKNGLCELKIVLLDDFGTMASVSRNIKFVTLVEDLGYVSIRGNGLDIMSYMQTALLGNVKNGYNDISFNIYNREDFSKIITVSVTGGSLGINFVDTVALNSNEFGIVNVPLFVSYDVEPGMYPVRFSVNYGTEKYSRYSYIQIK